MRAQPGTRNGRHPGWAALAVGLALVSAGAAPSEAAPAWIKRALGVKDAGAGRTVALPAVAHYRVDEGGGFILDRSERHSLLKFDDDPEIWVLTSTRGPRGDLIFTNDAGEVMLRTTRLGGATVFTPQRPDGAAATVIGPAASLRLATLGPSGLYQRLLLASSRASRAAGRLIGFEAPDADPTSDGLIADTALVSSDAVVKFARRRGGRQALAYVARVEIVRATRPSCWYRSGIVTIAVAPQLGLAGRPSSSLIQTAFIRH